MNNIELYVLVEDFTIDDIEKFIEKFLNNFIEISDYYEFPPYISRTEFETESFEEMLNFILSEKGRNYRFYLKPQTESEIQLGMIFFNKDKTLVLGVVIPDSKVEIYLNKIIEIVDVNCYLTTYEIVPPDSGEEFQKIAIPL